MRFFNFRLRSAVALRGVWLLWLVFAPANGVSCSAAQEITPSKGALVTLTFDKPRALVGENVILRYRLKNIGAKSFAVASSKNSYRLTAWYPDGKRAPVPYTGLFMSSDSYVTPLLRPGEDKTLLIPLLSHCLMDRAGTYRVRLEQVLCGETWNTRGIFPPAAGANSRKLTPVAIGETTLTLDAPSAEQARQIVDAMSKLPLRGDALSLDGQTAPFADYSILHHPAYLPVLKERALAGQPEAAVGVDSIATADATAVLIDACARGTLEFWGRRMLLRRIPPFEKPSKFNSEEVQRMSQPTLAEWRPTFGPVLRDWARHTLTTRATIPLSERYDQVTFAARLLDKLGDKTDKPLVDAAFHDTHAPPPTKYPDGIPGPVGALGPVGE